MSVLVLIYDIHGLFRLLHTNDYMNHINCLQTNLYSRFSINLFIIVNSGGKCAWLVFGNTGVNIAEVI